LFHGKGKDAPSPRRQTEFAERIIPASRRAKRSVAIPAPRSKRILRGRVEVNPVLKALREHGIEVTAIHNHMLDDQPHLYFMHFWANDDARKLAEGLKAAIAHINLVKS
jgi:hypothetical protein